MEFQVVVPAQTGEDDQEVATWTAVLLTELSDVSGVVVEPARAEALEDAKGLTAVTGMLLAKALAGSVAKALVEAARRFVARTGRSVEISLDGDVLKLTGVSREAQQLAIESWLARHPGS